MTVPDWLIINIDKLSCSSSSSRHFLHDLYCLTFCFADGWPRTPEQRPQIHCYSRVGLEHKLGSPGNWLLHLALSSKSSFLYELLEHAKRVCNGQPESLEILWQLEPAYQRDRLVLEQANWREILNTANCAGHLSTTFLQTSVACLLPAPLSWWARVAMSEQIHACALVFLVLPECTCHP